MFFDPTCERCGGSRFRHSRVRFIPEKIFGAFVAPFRCIACDRRQLKLRFIDLNLPELAAESVKILVAPHGGR